MVEFLYLKEAAPTGLVSVGAGVRTSQDESCPRDFEDGRQRDTSHLRRQDSVHTSGAKCETVEESEKHHCLQACRSRNAADHSERQTGRALPDGLYPQELNYESITGRDPCLRGEEEEGDRARTAEAVEAGHAVKSSRARYEDEENLADVGSTD